MKKVIKFIFTSVILMIVGAITFYNVIAEVVLLRILNKELNKTEDHIYSIHCQDVEIELLSGQLSLLNITISPKFKGTIGIQEFPIVVESTISKLTIEDFSWSDYWNEKGFVVKNIIVYSPKINLLMRASSEEKSNLEQVEYTETIAELFKSVTIGQVAINNCSIDLAKMSNPTVSIVELDSLSFFLDKIQIDSVQSKRDPFWFYENLEFDLKSVKTSIGKRYHLEAENLKISASNKNLSLENIIILPFNLSESGTVDFINRDYMKFDISKIELQGVDYREIVRTGNISVDEVIASQPKFEYLLDFVNPNSNTKKSMMPNSFLKKIETNININRVKVNKGSVVLWLKNEINRDPVPLSFQLIDAACNRVSLGEQWFEQRLVELNAKAFLQGKGQIDLLFVLPLKNMNDEFFIKGSLGEMSIGLLNPITEGTSYITMPTGVIQRIDFDFIANKYNSEGRLSADYSGLSIVVLKELHISEQKRRKHHMIATFLANNIIKKKNQPKSLLYREGYIEVEREEVTGFWEYLWQNLYAGMTHSLIHTEKKKKRKVKLYKKKRDLIQMYN